MNLKALLTWSEKEFPHLPWRKNRSLYRTLVSEIMLQQTTVGTVKNHYERFLAEFPTLESLANATDDELTVAWKGLGYYRRARNLKKIAVSIARDYQGEFPDSIEALMEIPGIGPYTANALIGIGMDRRALAVDANLERVIARLFQIKMEKGTKLQKEIQKLFIEKRIFPGQLSFRNLNEALMDLGRTYCQARKATCDLCPLKSDCLSFKKGDPLSLPIQVKDEKKKAIEHEVHLLRVFILKNKKLLVYRKSDKEWLAGQYEVPTFILSSSDEKLQQYPRLTQDITPLFSYKTGITKYKIQNSVLNLSEKEFKNFSFAAPLEWRLVASTNANFSTATLKGLQKLLAD